MNSSQQSENRFLSEMPGYLGSNMEFFRASGIDIHDNGIVFYMTPEEGWLPFWKTPNMPQESIV